VSVAVLPGQTEVGFAVVVMAGPLLTVTDTVALFVQVADEPIKV
jgi:hypothetical protein